jgi:hypothetical protein
MAPPADVFTPTLNRTLLNTTKQYFKPVSRSTKYGHILHVAQLNSAIVSPQAHTIETSPNNNSHTNRNSCGSSQHSPLLLQPASTMPLCGQFLSNNHVVANCRPTMTGLRKDCHNNALPLFISLLETTNGGCWDTTCSLL